MLSNGLFYRTITQATSLGFSISPTVNDGLTPSHSFDLTPSRQDAKFFIDAVAKNKKTTDYSEKSEMCENVNYQ